MLRTDLPLNTKEQMLFEPVNQGENKTNLNEALPVLTVVLADKVREAEGVIEETA